VTADAVAGSIALIGFGLDSLVEMSSGLVILWQFLHPVPESRERMALRPIGLSFFALAIYISVESVRNLIGGGEPAPSPVGIALAAVSLLWEGQPPQRVGQRPGFPKLPPNGFCPR